MLNCSASLAMSTSILKTMHSKLDIKRHSPSILYVLLLCGCSCSVSMPLSVISWSAVCSCDISLSYSFTL